VKALTCGTVSEPPLRWTHLALSRPYANWSLTAYLDETGDLIGYLEWAEFVMEETGAMFYMMRVSHNPSSWNQYQSIDK
jgi:hypothetical protein